MTTTALLITTIVIVMGIYDLCAVVIGKLRGQGIKYSISRFLQGLPRQAMVFTWAVFYILGHVFGFMPCPVCPDCSSVDNQSQKVIVPIPDDENGKPL